jgi:hypothetical protein
MSIDVAQTVSWSFVGLIGGTALGMVITQYRHINPRFRRQIRDLQDDVDNLYIARGLVPPSIRRYREELGLAEPRPAWGPDHPDYDEMGQ